MYVFRHNVSPKLSLVFFHVAQLKNSNRMHDEILCSPFSGFNFKELLDLFYTHGISNQFLMSIFTSIFEPYTCIFFNFQHRLKVNIKLIGIKNKRFEIYLGLTQIHMIKTKWYRLYDLLRRSSFMASSLMWHTSGNKFFTDWSNSGLNSKEMTYSIFWSQRSIFDFV